MKHTMHPLTDVIGHFSRQSRRMGICAGLGLLLILGSLGFGSYWLYRQNSDLIMKQGRLCLALCQMESQRQHLLALAERQDESIREAVADARVAEAGGQKDSPALDRSIEALENGAAELRRIAVERSVAERPGIAADHWGWYAVFGSYRTEKEARSGASRAISREGLRGDIIGVHLAENGWYALTLGGELSDRNEAQVKVEKAKQAFDDAYLRYGKNWTKVLEVGG